MIDEHQDAVDALLQAIDERLAGAPLVDRRTTDRRGTQQPSLIEASRVPGPIDRDFAYWVSPRGEARAAQ